jgi:hypothetical protein
VEIVVADTSVLIELERGLFLEVMFACGLVFAVPDALFELELLNNNGPYLQKLGLGILALSPAEMSAVQHLKSKYRGLSLPDCAAWVCARRPDHRLVTGDNALRDAALGDKIVVNGVLWVLDQFEASGKVAHATLHSGLAQIAADARCRLPRKEIDTRLEKWSDT